MASKGWQPKTKGSTGKDGANNPFAGFKYSAMSNLVLPTDRRFVHQRPKDEAPGDPESLAGRISVKDMGSRNRRDEAPIHKRKAPGTVEKGNYDEGAAILKQQQKRRKDEMGLRSRLGTFTQHEQQIEGLKYRPRTSATRATYELIITIVSKALGEVPDAVVRSAADAILEYLKDEEMKDIDKKREIDDIVGTSLNATQYNELVTLSRKITDYDADDEEEQEKEKERVYRQEDGKEEELDQQQGVAVVWQHDGDEQAGVEPEEMSESDEEMGGFGGADVEPEVDAEIAEAAEQSEDEDALVIGAATADKQDSDTDPKLVPAHEIDVYWLPRELGQIFDDAHVRQEKSKEVLAILEAVDEEGEEIPLREVENGLMELFEWDHHEVVQKLVLNRDRIVWATRWSRAAADPESRAKVEREMIAVGNRTILSELKAPGTAPIGGAATDKKIKLDIGNIQLPVASTEKPAAQVSERDLVGGLQPKNVINLENLVFDQGNHLMTNPNVKLPHGSTKRSFKGYEEIHVPAPKPRRDPNDPPDKPTSELPDWARIGFGSSQKLNRIQTQCYPMAFEDDGNMLICAPTGSGKTNVAMLAMLREIGKHRDSQTGQIRLDEFKIIYVAPLKALVQEQVGNFGQRLKPFGITVSELTGDRQLTKQQIAETQIIVTTPEKWDVITRKATDTSYTNLVRLICIDEIHLLHDDRGPVLESIVSRTIRRTEQTGEPVRLVGLSATLPNYRDVATFLRVDPHAGLFYFDGSFRPCPLKQEFIGVTDKKPIKQIKTMNDICYAKVLEQVGQNGQQMLIFVHSRKETSKTAKYIRDRALEDETMGQILRSDAASKEILREEAETINNADLKNLLPYGFGIHHAGMTRADRTSVEELFADGSIKVLVCTATLAWGVNLPAHTVIIKGTQIYSPEKGAWVELSPQDVLQMLGRAGRPQFDTYGEGIIITTQVEMQYYLSLMNQQLPIESQFMAKLADNLNAEIVLGNIRNRDEGVEWLGYTYLFVRMLRSPGLYSVGADYEDDDSLEQRRVDLIHSAAIALDKCGLVKYDKRSGVFQSTELGRIASHYYISHKSMQTYNHQLQDGITAIEMFRVFALSEEFKYIPVRQDEKMELAKLLQRVPVPVKETADEPQAKINVLLQAYISRLGLEGLAIMSDMVYVQQSANRILRAIFEICLKKGWAKVARVALDLCKTVEKRMWRVMTPLRQFPTCPKEVIAKAERMDVPWKSYFDLDPPRMGELLGMPKAGKLVCSLVERFPRLNLQVQMQPMTPSMLRVELVISPDFVWDDSIHGASEAFWIICTDVDCEKILFHDQFILRREYAIGDTTEHLVEFTVPLNDPISPIYFVSLISDRWMSSETKVPVDCRNLIRPEKFPPHTKLLDVQPMPVSALANPEYEALYPEWENFNKMQANLFQILYGLNDSVFIGSSAGTGKTVCAEFALLGFWERKPEMSKAVYVAPMQEIVDVRFKDWEKRLSYIGGGKQIVKLTGETTADLRLLAEGDLVLATPSQWDLMSRQWQRRKNVQAVKLFIADDVHLLGGQGGYIYETVISRMNAMASQLETKIRMIGLSVSLGNGRDMGEWIGAKKEFIFNYRPSYHAVPLELHIQSFTIPHFPSLMIAMSKPMYKAIVELSPDKPAMVFVASRKQVRSSALDLLAACAADDEEDRFLNAPIEEMEPILEKINERALIESLRHGIGYFHEALDYFDKRAVEHLFRIGAIQVLLVSRDSCWEIDCSAHLVVVMGTQFYEGREHRYIDYTLAEVLKMFGKAGRPGQDKVCKGVLMVPAVKRDYYKKFLNEALPLESQLHSYLHDALITEISTKNVTQLQEALDWTTYTYLFRRLPANPSYYGMKDLSKQGLDAFVSTTVEQALQELVDAKMIELDEEDGTITALNPAMIATYYNISFVTMQTLLLSLNAKTKLKGLLEIVSSATEFETIQIRRHEDKILRHIYDRVPVKLSQPDFNSPAFKVFVLLQAHFSRMRLPVDLAKDLEFVLKKALTLLSASVDVLSSEGHLIATRAMELSQMCVQAMWDNDSPLMQIPHFGQQQIEACQKYGIDDVYGFLDAMDPEENDKYDEIVQDLNLTDDQLRMAANFTNSIYPNVDMEFKVEDENSLVSGEPAYLNVHIERQLDEDEEPSKYVHAPLYPVNKTENWWIVVGEESVKSLYAIKRVTIGRSLDTKLEFVVPTAGEHELTLYLMCDSYAGVDQAPTFRVQVAQGEPDDEEMEE
jgi:pre-mRNA-splicing helicase BRR2